jgi:Zn-dependent protease/CBS domain-containing protein
MRWSLRLGSVSGIGIDVHWSFLILIGWVLLIHLSHGAGIGGALEGVVFVLVIFGCVVLHELGHALTAKRFGIRTRNITLLPIGGVARLERMPREPMREFLVAIAGPAVNVAIAVGLLAFHLLVMGFQAGGPVLLEGGFLERVMWVNVILVLFNLLPAFPMDGGRILRSLLALRLPYVRATRIAAMLGQGMAILFGLVGLFFNPFLVFIAFFVFLGAQQESKMVLMQSMMRGIQVSDAMITRFRTLGEDDTLHDAVRELVSGGQQDFPVTAGEHLVGLLPRSDLLRALAGGDDRYRVGDAMRRDCGAVSEDEPLERAFYRMKAGGCPMLPVLRGNRLVGIVTLESVGEYMMVNSVARGESSRSEYEDIYRSE